MQRLYVSALLLVLTGASSGVLSAGTITTSTSCSFYGQPTVSDPSSCSIAQESSVGDAGIATANSIAGYGISGNVLTVSLSQNLFIHEGNFATSNYGQFTGSITANGSIDLELQTTGSGTGFVQILASSLSSKDYAGEDGSEIGFNLAGSANSCEGGYPDACNFPPFPETPYPMGSVFSFTMSESSYAYTDPDHNPLSSVDGTTTFQFVFTDANGNPVNIAEVPEPGTMEFALIGALLAGLLTFARKRRKTNIAGF